MPTKKAKNQKKKKVFKTNKQKKVVKKNVKKNKKAVKKVNKKKANKKKVVKKDDEVKAPEMTGLKLRIKLKAYDHKIIDNSAKQIIDIANRFGVSVVGPIPLPTEIFKYTVNRSTFIHKNAREQFEMRVHRRDI